MKNARKTVTILMADDDLDDQMLVRHAWEKSRLCNDLRFVDDGEQLMDYLFRRGRYADAMDSPRPGIILLDLNMPVDPNGVVYNAVSRTPVAGATASAVMASVKKAKSSP